ncbi:MAG: porin [Pseudomonadota bacterium]
MKKVLMGTSAIALVGAFAGSAAAAEFEMKVGGYMEQHIAYADSDIDNGGPEDYSGIDSKQDAEIHFKPSITLDNGIKFGVDIQLEGNTSGDQIDESFMFIRGSFGEVLLGNENSAGYKMTYAAPDVTFVNVNSGSLTAFIPWSGTAAGVSTGDDVFRGTLGSTFLENARNNDAARFTYFTPRFAGFQLGVSYARDGSDDSNAQQNLEGAAVRDLFDIGANYVNSFGDIDVAVSGRYGIAFSDVPGGDDPEVFGAGLNIGFAGVTVGGSFAEQNNAGADDGSVFDVGISYETGPWGVSFTYMSGENVDDENAAIGADETADQFLLGAKYKLAKGVDLQAFGAYVDFEEDVGDAGGSGDDIDGFVIGTGIRLRF